MLSLCCTKIVRDRLRLRYQAQLAASVQPSTRLGNWYVHLARFGRNQIVLATSERSLLTVLLPARQLRERIEISFQAALAELLGALQLPAQVLSRELAVVELIPFAAASNRCVIGSMNEYVWQLSSYLARTSDLLELSLQLNNTPISAVGSKSSYGFPDGVARELLINWEH
jgi:hypothetical protein